MNAEDEGSRVVVLLPTGKDAPSVGDILGQKGIGCTFCESFVALLERMRSNCGPVLVGEEAFAAGDVERLTAVLDAQEEWSDLPVIVLLRKRSVKGRLERLAGRPSVHLLPRPVGIRPLLALLRAAVDNRLRQMAVRDMLAAQRALHESETALQDAKEALEKQVAERTRLAELRAVKLRKLALELIEAEGRERERLAHLLHDDLQQHLAAVKLKLETASAAGPQWRDSDSTIRTCVDLLIEAIRKTRRLSYDLSPPSLRNGGLAAGLELLANDMLTNYGLDVSFATSVETESLGRAMATFIYQALKELLFNVVKHAGTSTARVDIRKEDGCFVVRVADSGKGADVEQVYSQRGVTPGFGLFSIEERVQSLGGRMSVESIPGDGWVTTLFLPESRWISAESVGESTATESSDAEKDAIRIMVVDDHHVMREGLVSLLSEQRGLRVVAQAESGRGAVSLAGNCRPDVILMDVSMEGMNGVEATARIKNADPAACIVALSMHADAATRRSMMNAGAAAFVHKSDAPEKIVAVIREIVGRGRRSP